MRLQKRTVTAAFALLVAAWCAPAAGAQEATVPYRSTPRDPFTNYRVMFKRKPEKKESVKPVLVSPPAIGERIEQYKAQKRAAMNFQQPAPKPTTALLINELQVTGIFRTPRGYAAMVEASPIKLTYVIYPGEPLYNGMLVAIEENRLVFRRESRWSDGRREVAVETVPLRQQSVTEVMTAPKTEEAGQSAKSANKDAKSESAPTPEQR
jgi:hypothetical protein